jgi:hypothetical protein
MKRNIRLLIIPILVFTISCTKNIHQNFEVNSYVNKFNTHIFNDSLKFYIKTPADFTYAKTRSELKTVLKAYKNLESVLIYGKTEEYEYFVTTSAANDKIKSDFNVVLDTVINGQAICFYGLTFEGYSNHTLKMDLATIFRSIVIGEEYNKVHFSVFDIVNKYNKSNKYYSALREIKEFPAADDQSKWNKLQMELTFASYLGENKFYKEAIKYYENGFVPEQKMLNIIEANAVYDDDAISKLIEEAKLNKLLLINENHFNPNHRLLLLELLPKLKEIGYTTLALEALSPHQDSLMNIENGYPTLKTGYYTKEQNFSNVIRLAKELDFRFVGYENRDKSIDRELGQAQNIYNKTFKLDSTAKVVVLVGIDHLLEKETEKGKNWMATVMREKYNINPLTISQTHLNQYHSEMKSKYTLIKGKEFDEYTLNSIDYVLINTASQNTSFTNYFEYKSKFKFDIQISLFCSAEVEKSNKTYANIPYFTTIVKQGESIQLPYYNTEDIYLVTYNDSRKKISSELIHFGVK